MDQIRAKTSVRRLKYMTALHFTLMEFQMFKHPVQLHLGPNQVSIFSLNLV